MKKGIKNSIKVGLALMLSGMAIRQTKDAVRDLVNTIRQAPIPHTRPIKQLQEQVEENIERTLQALYHNSATYQGYRKDEGRYILYFDEEGPNRDGDPNVRVYGDPNNFQIGQSYNLELRSSPLDNIKEILDSSPSQ